MELHARILLGDLLTSNISYTSDSAKYLFMLLLIPQSTQAGLDTDEVAVG